MFVLIWVCTLERYEQNKLQIHKRICINKLKAEQIENNITFLCLFYKRFLSVHNITLHLIQCQRVSDSIT